MSELDNHEVWQQLLSLESRDIVKKWFLATHSKKLSTRRVREINASARQAREYFRNAQQSYNSVRPLLTYYGIACLSRALLLFFKVEGGEEGLTAGHGLEAVRWGDVMSGDSAAGLARLGELKIRRRAGLFSDFLTCTGNRTSIHIRSAGVNWSICYDTPDLREEFTVADLFSRLPDLEKDYSSVSDVVRYATISEMTYNKKEGFRAKVSKKMFLPFEESYKKIGYTTTCNDDWCTVTCDADTFASELPMFIHSYVNKMFGLIPYLYLAEPFSGGARYSQLCITYMVSYILGMLVRYYPTHWVSLTQGDGGDLYWPTVNRAQQFVEKTYPELVAELLSDAVNSRGWR